MVLHRVQIGVYGSHMAHQVAPGGTAMATDWATHGYTDQEKKMTATLEGISKANETAGTVLGGVVWLLMQDPQVRAMAENEGNDKQRFIEGCQNFPWFRHKVDMALLQIRGAALAL